MTCSLPSGDRYVTPWIKLIGSGCPSVPILDILLTKAGDELLGVKASVSAASTAYLHQHAWLVEEFKNESHWWGWGSTIVFRVPGGYRALSGLALTTGCWDIGPSLSLPGARLSGPRPHYWALTLPLRFVECILEQISPNEGAWGGRIALSGSILRLYYP
jgi:hypothetical protein